MDTNNEFRWGKDLYRLLGKVAISLAILAVYAFPVRWVALALGDFWMFLYWLFSVLSAMVVVVWAAVWGWHHENYNVHMVTVGIIKIVLTIVFTVALNLILVSGRLRIEHLITISILSIPTAMLLISSIKSRPRYNLLDVLRDDHGLDGRALDRLGQIVADGRLLRNLQSLTDLTERVDGLKGELGVELLESNQGKQARAIAEIMGELSGLQGKVALASEANQPLLSFKDSARISLKRLREEVDELASQAERRKEQIQNLIDAVEALLGSLQEGENPSDPLPG